METEYYVTEVSDVNEFKAIYKEWNEVVDKNNKFYPFICHEWYLLFLEYFKIDNFNILLLYNRSKALIAAFPLTVKKSIYKGLSVKTIELIGNVYSPVKYIIINNADVSGVINHILDYISTRLPYDLIIFDALPEEDPIYEAFVGVVINKRLRYSIKTTFGDWYLDNICYSSEEYMAQRPGNVRSNIPYRIRKLKKTGCIDIEIIDTSDNIEQIMCQYYELYSKSWQEKEMTGPSFHAALVRSFIDKKWIRIGRLLLDGKVIACQLWVIYDHYAYIIKLFYDQEYQKYAPGKILTAEMIKHVIDKDKVSTIDYVQGDDEYKKEWTPIRRERKTIILYRNNIKGAFLYILEIKIMPLINNNKYLNNLKMYIKAILNSN
jgi:Acetyltransferase (GNAT) domain